jgi:transaldolase
VKVGMTASYSAAQTYLACEARVTYSIAYVNRSTRLQGDGLALVSEMRAVVDACDTPTEILVASLKSTTEVVQAVIAGAQHVHSPAFDVGDGQSPVVRSSHRRIPLRGASRLSLR